MKKLLVVAAFLVLFIGCPSPDKNNSGVIDTKTTPVTSAQQDNYSAVPEPTTLILLGTGLVGIAVWGRRKKK